MTLNAGTSIGKYVVRRKLAEGGMAEIFLCSSRGAQGFAKDVVIKRIRSFVAKDPEFEKMFIAEARIACLLNHANVVQIFDFDRHDDTYYLAMEYIRGHSLWDVRVRSKELLIPVPPILVAHIGSEVARGLEHAHRLSEGGQLLGLVHRDVSPHNVLLSYDGAVKLMDFGIARTSNKLTAPGMIKGKFAYMSPEQARGDDVDARTDVFALGVVLWELLVGANLFDAPSDVGVLRAVQEREIPPPSSLNPSVPPELEAALMKALQRDPLLRFQSAQQFERALAQCVLRQAEALEDTDVGGFLVHLFGEAPVEKDLPPDSAAKPEVLFSDSQPKASAVQAVPTPAPVPLTPSGVARAGQEVEPMGHGDTVMRRSEGSQPTVELPAVHAPVQQPLPAPVQKAPVAAAPRPVSPAPKAVVPVVPEEEDTLASPRPSPKQILLVGGAGLAVLGLLVFAGLKLKPSEAPAPVAPVQAVAVAVKPPPEEIKPQPSPFPDEADPVAEPDEVPLREPVPEETKPVKPLPTEPVKAARMGTLLVKVRPWANVSVGGKAPHEVSGAKSYRLPPGRHVVKFIHSSGIREVEVQIEVGKTAVAEFDALHFR